MYQSIGSKQASYTISRKQANNGAERFICGILQDSYDCECFAKLVKLWKHIEYFKICRQSEVIEEIIKPREIGRWLPEWSFKGVNVAETNGESSSRK